MANHLEQLVAEWLGYKGYFVRTNVKVGRLSHGGFEGELDITAYHPTDEHLIHIETSIDSHPWERREYRFQKKFQSGQKYIIPDIFPWLPQDQHCDQWAVLAASDVNHSEIGGGKVVTIKKLYRMIAEDVMAAGNPRKNAIPEQFPLLRTMQYTLYCLPPKEPRGGTA